jgi:multiple antibiotic resistance protein
MVNAFLPAFIPLFVTFDLPGIFPSYLNCISGLDISTEDRRLRDSLLTSFLTALIFVIVSNKVMMCVGISMNDFLVAGGIVMFITAIREIMTDPSENETFNEMFGVVPLEIPLFSGPAVLATSVIISNICEYYYFLVSLFLNIIICGVALKLSDIILKVLEKRFIEALSRVLSPIIASKTICLPGKGYTDFESILLKKAFSAKPVRWAKG